LVCFLPLPDEPPLALPPPLGAGGGVVAVGVGAGAGAGVLGAADAPPDEDGLEAGLEAWVDVTAVAGLGVVLCVATLRVAALCVFALAVVVVLAASLAVEVVLVEPLPQPATPTAAAATARYRARGLITTRLTRAPGESFGGPQRRVPR
jgi:hypothetical protein